MSAGRHIRQANRKTIKSEQCERNLLKDVLQPISHSTWALASQGTYRWQFANCGRRYATRVMRSLVVVAPQHTHPQPRGRSCRAPGSPEPGTRKKTSEPPTHNWRGQVHPDEHDTALLEPNVYLVGERGRGQHRRPPPLYTLRDPAQNTQKRVPT